ncbi:MAG TPA: hypothetical protein PKD37_00900 [Oligoflexia bacterium]|nr:hypothetical protein [Oligoflexia bacterium]HMP26538.1 hypothetical protein [Oligoflexia bacterium]
MKISLFFMISCFLIFCGIPDQVEFLNADSGDQMKECAKVVIGETTATADNFANMMNRERSLRRQFGEIFGRARQQGLEQLKAGNYPSSCGSICSNGVTFSVLASSIPNSFAANSSDAEYCNQKEAETKNAPYKYLGKQFASLDDFSSWVKDFSSGSGNEGKDLYKKCDRKCSPQYHYSSPYQAKTPEIIQIDATVFCGPERDKDENLYKLKAELLWRCL